MKANSLNVKPVYNATNLTELAVKRQEGKLTKEGVLVVETGSRTGRSPKDRFLVRDNLTESEIEWNETNQAFKSEDFEYWNQRAEDHLKDNKDYLTDTFQVGNNEHGVLVRVTTEYAWHMLFAHNLFTQVTDRNHNWELYNLPNCVPEGGLHGAKSNGLVVINF